MAVRSPVLEQRYIYEHELGQWTYGTTQVLRDLKTDRLKTCKVVPKALVQGRTDVLPRLQKLKELSHPFVCSVTDVLEDPSNYFIISDAYSGGDLGDWLDRLDKNQFWMTEPTVSAYIAQLAAAMAYCHSQQVYHRDLRPCSVQLTSKMPDATVMVSDFGLVEILDPDSRVAQWSPNAYAAPELRSHTGRVSGGAPDVWSIGAITYALLIGHPPRDEGFDLSPSRLLLGAPDKDAWAGRSASSHELVHWLMQVAGDRPTAARILNHRWLKTVVIPSFPAGSEQDAHKEVRKKQVCYLTGVLLIPAEVLHDEVKNLRAAFRQADHDYDGLLQTNSALELLLSMPTTEASSSSSAWREDLEEALQVIDVRATGVVDLCSATCALALARARVGVGMQAPKWPRPPLSPSAQRLALEDECLQRALDCFFEVYGEARSRSVVPVSVLAERLHSPVAHEMEVSAGVNYDEMLCIFRDMDYIDRNALATELLECAGRGTPLSWGPDIVTQEVEIDNCWEPHLSIDGIDRFLRGAFFMSCGASADDGARPVDRKLFDLDCPAPAQCVGSSQE